MQKRYDFGRNWSAFAAKIDDQKIQQAQDWLSRLFPDLQGTSFLDIGCGSGLHSLAALHLGASHVTAIDIDADSVRTTRDLLEKFAPNKNWTVEKVDITDKQSNLGMYDNVYSWGVLHHTGDMWNAITKSTNLVAHQGHLALALYLKTSFCSLWRIEKRIYANSHMIRPFFKIPFAFALLLRQLLSLQNPLTYITTYAEKGRGMSFWNDIDDWLGGYPYESVDSSNLNVFLEQHNFTLVREFNTQPGIGLLGTTCGEWVFKKT